MGISVGEEDPLDEAWRVKAREEPWGAGFDFVVANPPYVTPKRQPVLDQVRHTPFFSEALAQDLNLYLLFFRLAEHYLADGGSAVLISPLTLLGDDSAENTRRLVTNRRLRLTGVSRFYRGTVLFPGVDQMVMIARFEAGDPGRADPDVELRGGLDENEAAAEAVTMPGPWVVSPPKPEFPPALPDPWTNAWLHVADEAAHEIWRLAADAAGANVHHLLERSLSARQGDVNTASVRPLLRDAPGPHRMPAYTAKAAQPLASIPEPEEWAEVPASPRPTGHEAVLDRIAGLTEKESGIILQEMANVHVTRRLQATWFERDSSDPKVFLHTLWRFVAKEGQERHAKAILGFLSSGLASYLFGLWSTNNHVQANTLRRLPCPTPDTFPEEELAEATDSALEHRAAAEDAISGGLGRFVRPAGVKMAPTGLLRASGVPTITLADAELRGTITRQSSGSQRVDRLLGDGRLQAADPRYLQEVTSLLRSAGSTQWERAKGSLLLPEPAHLGRFVAERDRLTEAAERAARDFEAAREAIDAIVADWYGLPDELARAAARGVPFSYANARASAEDQEEEEA